MVKRSICIAAMVALGLATGLDAAVVILSVEADLDAKTWEVRADVTGDSDGIRGFSIDVYGEGGDVDIASMVNESVEGLGLYSGPPQALVPFGFTLFRSAGPVDEGGETVHRAQAAQDAVYGAANDPKMDWGVLQGIGQVGGSREHWWQEDPPFGQWHQEGRGWDASVLLASGTYTGDTGKIVARGGTPADETAGWGLLRPVGSWEGPGNLEDAEEVVRGEAVIPEPGTLVLLAVGALGLLVFWWRRK